MRFSHFTEATAYQCGTIEAERRSVVGAERLAVHLVGDQDLRRRIGRVGERQRRGRRSGRPARSRQDRAEVVGAVVGALEPDLDAVRRRARLREDVVQAARRVQRAVETA